MKYKKSIAFLKKIKIFLQILAWVILAFLEPKNYKNFRFVGRKGLKVESIPKKEQKK